MGPACRMGLTPHEERVSLVQESSHSHVHHASRRSGGNGQGEAAAELTKGDVVGESARPNLPISGTRVGVIHPMPHEAPELASNIRTSTGSPVPASRPVDTREKGTFAKEPWARSGEMLPVVIIGRSLTAPAIPNEAVIDRARSLSDASRASTAQARRIRERSMPPVLALRAPPRMVPSQLLPGKSHCATVSSFGSAASPRHLNASRGR